jgi:tRNA (cmo5U34)-methyltransferase
VVNVEKDQIYSQPLKQVGNFAFDDQVVGVFPDMIKRSVPGYGSILSMIGEVAASYVKPATQVYDLGCSLGACTLVIRPRIPTDCVIHALDSSPSMTDALEKRLRDLPDGCEVRLACQDIRRAAIEYSSLSVLNFTLQFVPKDEREDLLRRVAKGTVKGGALVLSEKICFEDEAHQELLTTLHHSFKRANGYSDLEIAQKRTALENTLIPEYLETHLDRLKRVGFSVATCWFQCFNFVSILAVK